MAVDASAARRCDSTCGRQAHRSVRCVEPLLGQVSLSHGGRCQCGASSRCWVSGEFIAWRSMPVQCVEPLLGVR